MSADTVSAAAWVSDTPAAAWSACEPPDIIEHVAGPRWSRALLKVGAAAIAVGSALGGGLLLLNPALPPIAAAPAVVAAPAQPTKDADPPPFIMPTITAAQETVDGAYIAQLAHASIDTSAVSRADVIANGHRVCMDMAAHAVTMPQLAQRIAPQFPQLTRAQVNSFVSASVAAYCPQYGGGQ